MRRRDSRGAIELPRPAEPFEALVGGNVALDFANTVDVHCENRRYDHLFPGYGNVLAWALHAGVIAHDDARALMQLAKRDAREAAAVRRRAVSLREAIFDAMTSPGTIPDPSLPVLNNEWQRAIDHRQLTPVSTWSWVDEPFLDRVLWPIAIATIELLTSPQRDRVRTCASPDCDWVFIDSTKNGSRRFCRSGQCGNRTRVQRFRAEKRSTSA